MIIRNSTRPVSDRQRLRRQILIVEDNIEAAHLLRKALKFQGHEVSVAHDGNSAIEALAHEKPEVVLLDLGLPGIDGFEVARRIRSTPKLRDLLIIAITASDCEMDRRRSKYIGIDCYLSKPVNLDELDDIMRARLSAAEATLMNEKSLQN